MQVTEKGFLDTFDKWASDVRHESLLLLRADVAPERCGNVAIAIVEGKTIATARRLSEFGGAGPRSLS